jgi:hypothetical protein
VNVGVVGFAVALAAGGGGIDVVVGLPQSGKQKENDARNL